jgi:DDE superfamily endonuclease
MGLSQSKQYGKYYRVLSRVGWSGLAGARILLGMILALLSPKQAIVIGIDETLERRWGSKIWGRGIYRDAVKSSIKHQVKSSGVRWQVMQVLLPLPWSKRVWGLPFLSVMVPSKETARVGERGYKSSLDWATQMVSVVKSLAPSQLDLCCRWGIWECQVWLSVSLSWSEFSSTITLEG